MRVLVLGVVTRNLTMKISTLLQFSNHNRTTLRLMRRRNLWQPSLRTTRYLSTRATSNTIDDKEQQGLPPISDLNELTVLGIDHVQGNGTPTLTSEDPYMALPNTTLMLVADTEVLQEETYHHTIPGHRKHRTPSLMSNITEMDFASFDTNRMVVHNWDRKKKYSDLILEGVRYQSQNMKDNTTSTRRTQQQFLSENIVMLFESPSTSSTNTAFTNTTTYRFHDWPPLKSTRIKGILGPGRYASMNGDALPVFLREDAPPGLVEHWQKYIPGFVKPYFVPKIEPDQTVYAFLPVESLDKHVNDPSVHYHLAGKDAIHLMTQKTARLLEDTKTVRPCVVKTTHSMGSKGIFIIADDHDEARFKEFLKKAGNPTFVVTDFVDIHRNVACHFFMHPDGSIVWFGSNENHRLPNGKFSSDSYLLMKDQAKLKRMQMPFVEEVVTYCQSLNFWGFCGIDVLFDSKGKGYLIDINPRVTGSCPALMTLSLLNQEYNYSVGLFRRTGANTYHGSASELLEKVDEHNHNHTTTSTHIILHSFLQINPAVTKVNIGVYGHDLDQCKRILNTYAKPAKI